MENEYIKKTSGITAKDKIGYAMGDVASLLVFGLVQSVLQKFYTDYLKLSLVSVMILFIIARVWDAFNDPLWGRIVDTVKCRPGERYRRWLKYLGIPLAVLAVAMFADVRGLGTTGAFVYACITYILFGMLYTGTNIPYGSLATVVTTDEKERNALSIFRSIGSTFGALPAMALISFCYKKDENGNQVMDYKILIIGVIVLAILSAIAYFICYKLTKERVVTKPREKKEKGETFKTIKGLLSNRAFLIISIVGMLFLASQMFQTTYNTYLFHYYFKSTGLTMLPTICQYVPVAVIMFFSGKLCRVIGKKEICALGMLLTGIAFGVLGIFQTTNPWVYIAVCFVAGIGNAFIFLMIWSLATDAIDDYTIKFGRRDDGTAYSLFTFMRKLGQTIAAIISCAGLLAINYDVDRISNDDAMLKGMYLQSVIIPCVLSILIFVLLWFVYPLGKKKLAELQIKKNEAIEKSVESGESSLISEENTNTESQSN